MSRTNHLCRRAGAETVSLPRLKWRRPREAVEGFTLVETLVSATIIILITLSVVPAMLQMNTTAMASRLTTMATLLALNQIELAQTDSPFSPPDGQIPVGLTPGEQTSPVIIYDDPNWDQTVSGTLTTTVEVTAYPYVHKVTVTVRYKFRNRDYVVSMHSLRASDA